MSERERTRQQLDPAGTLRIRPLTILLSAGSFGYAVVMTVRSTGDIAYAALAVLALVVLAGACATVVIATSPYRAPLTRRVHILVHLLVLLAVVLSAAAEWNTNRHIRDDWWPVSFGLLLMALSHYRPAMELAAAASLSAIFVGFLTLFQSHSLVGDAPPVVFVLVAVVPMLGLCYAAVAYGNEVVNALECWKKSSGLTSASLVDRFREGITRSVQQDRVTILSRDVLPFFTEVVARDTVTDADRDRARAIAESIRSVMVAEADRSWLEGVVEVAAGRVLDCDGDALQQVSDDARLATRMTSDQRTILRALIIALFDEPSFDSCSLRIVLVPDGLVPDGLVPDGLVPDGRVPDVLVPDGRVPDVLVPHGPVLDRLNPDGPIVRVAVTADIHATEHAVRSLVVPYIAVMRVVFNETRVDLAHPRATIRFSYGQH